MSNSEQSETHLYSSINKDNLKIVPVDHIVINPFQPRKEFALQDLEDLANSLKLVGMIHPPTVCWNEIHNNYELICGERRWRAAQLAGFKEIPVIIKDAAQEARAQAALIENLQRVDLNPLEIALALKKLIEEFHYTQSDLATKVGKQRSTVANYLRLLTLPVSVQDALRSNLITMGHAKAILSFDSKLKQEELCQVIIRDSLTVRESEKLCEQKNKKKIRLIKKPTKHDLHAQDLGRQLETFFNLKVSLEVKTKSKGSVQIYYENLDELDLFLEKIGYKGKELL